MLVHLLAKLHSAAGPLAGEALQGASQLVCRTAAAVASEVLRPTLAPPCAELGRLADALTAAAGGSSDGLVDLDAVLEAALEAWAAQRRADQAALEAAAAAAAGAGAGGGIATTDQLAQLIQQVRRVACLQHMLLSAHMPSPTSNAHVAAMRTCCRAVPPPPPLYIGRARRGGGAQPAAAQQPAVCRPACQRAGRGRGVSTRCCCCAAGHWVGRLQRAHASPPSHLAAASL